MDTISCFVGAIPHSLTILREECERISFFSLKYCKAICEYIPVSATFTVLYRAFNDLADVSDICGLGLS